MGETERLKSKAAGGTKWKTMSPVVCERVLLVPVTVTVKSVVEETVAVQESVAVCGELPKVRLAWLRVHVSPAGVEADAERLTVPVKPFSAVTVIVEVPEEPELMLDGLTGPTAMLKSVTWKRMSLVVCESVPLVPVTLTV